jgi:hypothetical protein
MMSTLYGDGGENRPGEECPAGHAHASAQAWDEGYPVGDEPPEQGDA